MTPFWPSWGTPDVVQTHAALAILTWAVLGVPLAFKKGQIGTSVKWIGASFTVQPTGVAATITAERLDEMHALTKTITASNLFSVKALRTYTGKAQAIASLLYVWRPFVHMLYGAISAETFGGAPQGHRWTKQIATPTRRLKAFLDQQQGSLVRSWSVSSFNNQGPRITITTDACPWGLGATLEVNGELITFLSGPITADDRSPGGPTSSI